MTHRIVCVWLVLVLVAMVASAETPIQVTVDGAQVQFGVVGPQTVQGRVFVPLRGVLERVGAFVGWDPANRQVIAQRGDRDVVLRVGDKNATVNGQPVVMDVPAMIVTGTTMVPLRFLGEALGGEIRWNAGTRTVEILTGGDEAEPPTPPSATAELQISSCSHNATGWLRAGDVLRVTLQGTSGAVASFVVPGVVKQVSMREVSPGRYTGEWSASRDTPSISEASVIGSLAVGQTSTLLQAAASLRIDVAAPAIRNLTPAPGSQSVQARPTISAVWDDGAGSGVDLDRAVLKVNGEEVTEDASLTESFISYRPARALPSGSVSVSLSVSDVAGNVAQRAWEYTTAAAADAITSFTYAAPEDLIAGDAITATLKGREEGTASFWLVDASGRRLRTQAMQETTPGTYTGEYVVRRSDVLAGAEVVGSLTLASGESYTLQATTRIGGVETHVSSEAPMISRPLADSRVRSPLVVSGTAPRNARVRIKVDYVMAVLGALGMRGTLAEQVAEADDRGSFASDPIDLSTPVQVTSTQYTLTAVTVFGDGQESEPTVVEFTRDTRE